MAQAPAVGCCPRVSKGRAQATMGAASHGVVAGRGRRISARSHRFRSELALRLTRTSWLIDQLQIVQRRLLDAGAASRRRHGTSAVGTAQRDGRDGQPWRGMRPKQTSV